MQPIVTDVAWSGLLVAIMNCAETAKPIIMPFEFLTWVGSRNHALGGGLNDLRGNLVHLLGKPD